MKLSGHTVLITGGASGIGLALTKQFVRYDNKVIVVGRNESKLAELSAQSPQITGYTCDIGKENEVDRLVTRIMDEHPDLSVLVNNAGIQFNGSFMESDAKDMHAKVREEIDVNLVAPIGLITRLLPVLSRHDEAAIINVSSGLGLVPKSSAPVYCATKAGLHLFTKALRYQLESSRIKVFEIIPPIVDTGMTSGRGKGKVTPEQLAAEFWRSYRQDRLEVRIGKVKLLHGLNRIIPSYAEALLKNS